jgi:hypothetical protein
MCVSRHIFTSITCIGERKKKGIKITLSAIIATSNSKHVVKKTISCLQTQSQKPSVKGLHNIN